MRPLKFDYGSSEPDYLPISGSLVKGNSLFLSKAFTSNELNFVYRRGKFVANSYNEGLLIYPDFSKYDVTGGVANWTQNGVNNLIKGYDFGAGGWKSFKQGALSGALSGALGGGIEGYKYAEKHNANPWTNKILGSEHKYEATLKKGVAIQLDPTKHCYAYVAAYADAGHGNHKVADFIFAAKGGDGGDFAVLGAVSKEAKRVKGRYEIEKLLEHVNNFGANIQSNIFEAAGTINQGSHWVNIIGISWYDRISWFGGKITTNHIFKIWDPIGGTTSLCSASAVTNITIFRF